MWPGLDPNKEVHESVGGLLVSLPSILEIHLLRIHIYILIYIHNNSLVLFFQHIFTNILIKVLQCSSIKITGDDHSFCVKLTTAVGMLLYAIYWIVSNKSYYYTFDEDFLPRKGFVCLAVMRVVVQKAMLCTICCRYLINRATLIVILLVLLFYLLYIIIQQVLTFNGRTSRRHPEF